MHALSARPDPIDEAALAAAYPWPEGPWLRAMMLQTLDGAPVGPDRRSKSLSGPADMKVFAETRRLADAILIGAQTMRAERYNPLRARSREDRAAAGQAVAPRLVIVSRSLALPWEEPVFRASPVAPLVVTSQSAPAELVRAARRSAEVLVLPGDPVGMAELVAAIRDRGLLRITCEGGPRLLAELVAADLVDEADITIAPVLAGGGQIHTGDPMGSPRRYALAGVLSADGYLFTRYLREADR